MSQLLIQSVVDMFNDLKKFAHNRDFGYEILDFALPMNLDDEGEYTRRLEFYKDRIGGEFCSLHGVFNDMRLNSPDPKIREVAQNRLEHCCQIADKLKLDRIVFHTNYIPQVSHPRYISSWEQRNADFFTNIIEKYQVDVLLENVFDFSPEPLAGLMQRVNSDRINVCFDIGHYNIHSRVDLQTWFKVLGNNIKYLHINDNDGMRDTHSIIGEGSINWQKFSSLLASLDLSPPTVMEVEVGNLEAIKKSLAYLERNEIYPC